MRHEQPRSCESLVHVREEVTRKNFAMKFKAILTDNGVALLERRKFLRFCYILAFFVFRIVAISLEQLLGVGHLGQESISNEVLRIESALLTALQIDWNQIQYL